MYMKKMMKVFSVIMILVLTITPIANAVEKTKVTITGLYDYDYAYEVVKFTNIERQKLGLKPLKVDKGLMDAAMIRAAELSVYCSHDRPMGWVDGVVTESGNIRIGAENLARSHGRMTPQSIVAEWMSSPGHKAQIVNGSYKSIGVGVYWQNGQIFWIQEFSVNDSTNDPGYTGEKEVTQDVEIDPDFRAHYKDSQGVVHWVSVIDLKVTGFDDVNELKVGETKKPTKVSLINVGTYAQGMETTTILPSNVTWKSSNTKVFTVDTEGVVTAVGDGEAELTATLGNTSLSWKIKVDDPLKLVSISLPNSAEVYVKDTVKLSVTYKPANTTSDKTVTWESDSPNVATVDSNGVVTGKGVGMATITARVGNKTATCKVTVKFNDAVLTLEDSKITTTVNRTVRVTVLNPVKGKITYKSNNDRVATVNDSGVVTAVGEGTAIITITSDGKSATCEIQVLKFKKGDLDGNGQVDTADAAVALNLFKYNNATAQDIAVGDMDGNGIIDTADAAEILNVFKYGSK